MIRPPPRPFLGSLALRALILWTFARVVTWVGSSTIGSPDPVSIWGGPLVSVGVLLVVLFVSWVELGRRAERVFLANLGWSVGRIAAFITAECLALELVLRLSVG